MEPIPCGQAIAYQLRSLSARSWAITQHLAPTRNHGIGSEATVESAVGRTVQPATAMRLAGSRTFRSSSRSRAFVDTSSCAVHDRDRLELRNAIEVLSWSVSPERVMQATYRLLLVSILA